MSIICAWCSYDHTICRKIIHNSGKFCNIHQNLIDNYSKTNGDGLCQTIKRIKIVPRSHKYVKFIFKESIVQAYIGSLLLGEVDITNDEFIVYHNLKFYYEPTRSQNKAINLRLLQTCQNSSVISFNDIKYCEECYKTQKKFPLFSCIQ